MIQSSSASASAGEKHCRSSKPGGRRLAYVGKCHGSQGQQGKDSSRRGADPCLCLQGWQIIQNSVPCRRRSHALSAGRRPRGGVRQGAVEPPAGAAARADRRPRGSGQAGCEQEAARTAARLLVRPAGERGLLARMGGPPRARRPERGGASQGCAPLPAPPMCARRAAHLRRARMRSARQPRTCTVAHCGKTVKLY